MTLIALLVSKMAPPIFLSDLLVTAPTEGQSSVVFSPLGAKGQVLNRTEQVGLAFKTEILDRNTCMGVSGAAKQCIEALNDAQNIAKIADFEKRQLAADNFFKDQKGIEYIWCSVDRSSDGVQVLSNLPARSIDGSPLAENENCEAGFAIFGGTGTKDGSGDNIRSRTREIHAFSDSVNPFVWLQIILSRCLLTEVTDTEFVNRHYGGHYSYIALEEEGWTRHPIRVNVVSLTKDEELLIHRHSRTFLQGERHYFGELDFSRGTESLSLECDPIRSINDTSAGQIKVTEVSSSLAKPRLLDVSISYDTVSAMPTAPLIEFIHDESPGVISIKQNSDVYRQLKDKIIDAKRYRDS